MMSMVESMNLSIDFRLFLRNYFYPKNQQLIQDNLYNSVQSVEDIDCLPQSMYRLKCKTRRASANDINGINIENALINILSNGNIESEIASSNITDDKRYKFLNLYYQIMQQIHFCKYIKTLYTIAWFPTNTTTFFMEVGL